MDIKCIKCGEPWDRDTIHEEVAERFDDRLWMVDGRTDQKKYEKYFDQVREDFYKNGCRAFYGAKCNTESVGYENGEILSELYDVFGDDTDAMANMIEDFDL